MLKVHLLIKEFQALGLDITVLNEFGSFVELKDLEESDKELGSEGTENDKKVESTLVSEDSNDEIFEEYEDAFADEDYEDDEIEYDEESEDDDFEDEMDDDDFDISDEELEELEGDDK